MSITDVALLALAGYGILAGVTAVLVLAGLAITAWYTRGRR